MAQSAPGTAFSLLLLAYIIQGNPGSPVLSLIYYTHKGGLFTICLKSVLAFLCDELPLCNALILSACIPVYCSMQYPLQNVSDFVSSLASNVI